MGRHRIQIQADTEWMASGNCRTVDPSTMFGEDAHEVKLAQEVCEGCVVRITCLDYALTTRQDHGVWGGISERGRRKILRERNRARQQVRQQAASS